MTISEYFQQTEIVPGVIALYKPYGISSTAVTELYKRWTKEKVGHGGTLDPLAEGQLILGIGMGTKKLTEVLSSNKKYRTTIIVGAASPSGDIELPILLHSLKEGYKEQEVRAFFEQLQTGITHPLTSFSAVKVAGKTAYDRTRKGESFEMKEVTSRVLEYQLHNTAVINNEALSELFEERLRLLQQQVSLFEEVAASADFFAKRYRFLLEKWIASFEQSLLHIKGSQQWKGLLVDVTVLVPKGTYIRSIAQLLGVAAGTEAIAVRLERLSA